jgi:iron complex outermembrane recepter protein
MASSLAVDGATGSEQLPAGRDSVIPLPVVEVQAPRLLSDSLLRVAPGFAQGYDVAIARGRPVMVSDLLDGAVGVHVRTFGGVGSFATASIRGASAAQVSVYLDGVPLNRAQYGVVNLADLPIEALDRVEVFRGAAPLVLESPGGGAINLVSRRGLGRWARVSAGAGSFGTRRSDAAAGWQARQRSVLLVAQFLESRGDYPYLDDNATESNTSDDVVSIRQNNQIRSLGLTGRGESDLGPVRLALVYDHLSKRNGVPGIGANPALTSSLAAERDLASLLISHPGGRTGQQGARDRLPGASLRLYNVFHRDQFSDPQGHLTGLRQASDDRTHRLGTSAAVPWLLPLDNRLTLVGEARREEYAPALVLPTQRALAQSRRHYLAWGIEDRWTCAPLRLRVVGSFRREQLSDSFPAGPAYPGALPSPAVSRTIVVDRPTASLHVELSGGFALKGSIARLARAPTLEELFGNRGGIYGNPRALPERVETGDLGVICHRTFGPRAGLPSSIEVQVSGYRSVARDLLVYIQNSRRSVVSQNISAARLSGLEADARLTWIGGLGVNASWTRQWTRDEGEVTYWRGKELPGRPRDELALQASYATSLWRVFYSFHYVASNFIDRYNSERVPERSLHDIGIRLRLLRTAVEALAECRNATDQRVHDYAGYPLPGRALYLGLSATINRREGTP